MKSKLLLSGALFSLLFTSLYGQLSLGKPTVNGPNTILDFDDSPGNTKGLILPAITTLPASPANGNFVFDINDSKVKMYENEQWVELSEDGSNADIIHNNTPETGGGAIIGADSSTAEGVLVLEAPDKAMVLPKIANPHSTVKSPYPGMICYDTVSKSMAVFDGSKWYYWK